MEFLKDLSIDKVRNIAEDAFNQAKPKTDVEARVYEVLSHKNWGASSSLMHEIARDTFDAERFYVVTRLMWEGMENQRPAAWKIVFKALTLLEFLVKNGAERCVDDARNHGHVLRAMGQFNYYEGTIDRGLGVREKSKQIMEILGDDDRIREERQKAKKLRQKFGSNGATASGGGRNQGYGNQDSWNNTSGGDSGGGYGQGGIESSPYESGGGYSGRYSGSKGGEGGAGSSAAPTFASIPDNKPKKSKKKKKPVAAEVPVPAPAPEVDLFTFDDPAPAPAPAAATNDDFGAFQATPAPAAADDDDFGAFVASKSSQPDPFAAPAPQPPAPVASFDAFGNAAPVMQAAAPMAQNNNMMTASMNNAFGNMSLGQTQQQQAPMVSGGGANDDFGDFTAAAPKSLASATASNPGDPMSKLVSLDGLSKNPRNAVNQNNNGQNMGFGMGGMNNMQTPNNTINSTQAAGGVVSAGGGDAISSLFAPPPVNTMQGMGASMQNGQAQQQGGMMSQMGGMPQQQQGMMNQGNMQQQGMMNQMGGMQQMNPQMVNTMNPMMNQQQGMQANGMMMGGGMQQGGMNPQMMQQGGMQGNMMGVPQGVYNQQQMGGMNMNNMGMPQQQFR